MDLPLAVLFTDALVGGEPGQGGFQRGQAVAGGQAHVKQLSRLLTRHTGTHRVTAILRTGGGGLPAPRIVHNDDPKESRLFKPNGWVLSEAPPNLKIMCPGSSHLSVRVIWGLCLEARRAHQHLPAAVVLRRSALQNRRQRHVTEQQGRS